MSQPNPYIEITKVVECKRCGTPELGWVLSSKGKWYLCPTFVDSGNGTLVANRFNLHKCPARQQAAHQ
jgi:hypothetical protein